MATNGQQTINSGNEELNKKIDQWLNWDKVRIIRDLFLSGSCFILIDFIINYKNIKHQLIMVFASLTIRMKNH